MKQRLIKLSLAISITTMILTLPLYIWGILVGPQELHYFNISLIIGAIITILISIEQSDNWIKINERNKKLIRSAIAIALISITSSAFLVKIKYGYFNWRYKNVFILQSSRIEKSSLYIPN